MIEMAIVKGPALSIEASGNLGAICYSKHGSLQIARAVWTGTVPNTTKQVVQQGFLKTASQAWGSISFGCDRDSYNNLAKSIVWRDRLGSPYIPSGYQLFMKWNIRRLVMGLGLMVKAPPIQEWVDVKELVIFWHAVGPKFIMRLVRTVTPVQYPESYGVEIYKAGPYNSGGRNPIEGEWRFLTSMVPPTTYYDTDINSTKFYWYRARAIVEFGDVQNWFEEQVYAQ